MQNKTTYSHNTHKELVDACAKGDRKSQMKIYDLYYKAMYNTSLRIVNDTLVAEDIMQDSFLDAFNKLNTFEWRSSFGSWLKRIVVNKSLDSIRKRIDIVPISDELEELHEEDNLDQENIECKIEEVKLALKMLSESNKIILILHLFEGYDHQEISQILNMSYSNVRVKYMRAKNNLIKQVVANNRQHALN